MVNYEDYEQKFQPRQKRIKPNYKSKTQPAQIKVALTETPNEEMPFSYLGSKYEREWITNYLEEFYNEHLITDVLRLVKGGKEATVYCCAAHPNLGVDLLAAKIYRPRQFRQLRNDSLYRQGRKVIGPDGKAVIDFAELNALAKGTAFGKELQHTSWMAHENEALTLLHNAGADVPRSYACGDNAILMTYMGEADSPAPTLNKVKLDRRQARPIFDRLIANMELMLKHHRIHGDLSAFNVLYWEGEVMIIDFPQAIDPYVNSQARKIFNRDVRRLCDYFDRYGDGVWSAADANDLAETMWKRYVIEKEEVPVEEEE